MNKNLIFLKLCKNTKKPIHNSKITNKKSCFSYEQINKNMFNVGIHAEYSNLIILDIDVADKGIEEFEMYVKMYGEPLTVKQKTPKGGFHLLFNSTSDEYTEEQKNLIGKLKNKAKYRGKGVDIRIGKSGYIVCEPSKIDDKEYKFVRHYNNHKILDIPLSLLNWILEFEKDHIGTNLKLIMTMDEFRKICKKLSQQKFYNGTEWFKVTSCFKNLLNIYNNFDEEELQNIWDEWSEQGEK